MARGETRTKLLDVGRCLFSEMGYHHAGIDAILKAAGVPKGSFYNYFPSKEDFGLQVIDSIAECYDAEIAKALDDPDRPPMERLRGYFLGVIDRLGSNQCRNGCLVGNLGQEMADQNERFRARLEEVFGRWVERFAACVAEAQTRGEFPDRFDPRDFAAFCLNSWQGAILRAKMARSTHPLRLFLEMTFEGLVDLGGTTTAPASESMAR